MIQENIGPKYSEMLMRLVKEFDEQLPDKLTFEETLEVGVDAWNLANNKDFLVSKKLYNQELANFKNHSIIEKMVDFKIEKFSKFNNVIVDYSTKNNILQVKTQTQENHFNSIIKQMVNIKPKKKETVKR
ncbi:MAG: hypothetical protein JKX97_00530 [Candidatus Lindowbacteria bacterium]|nr:hypothetical protein [Candidatus Lindowbacteria bacterium]